MLIFNMLKLNTNYKNLMTCIYIHTHMHIVVYILFLSRCSKNLIKLAILKAQYLRIGAVFELAPRACIKSPLNIVYYVQFFIL